MRRRASEQEASAWLKAMMRGRYSHAKTGNAFHTVSTLPPLARRTAMRLLNARTLRGAWQTIALMMLTISQKSPVVARRKSNKW